MALYISISNEFETGKWNISSYGKEGDIEIFSYPSIEGGPANKSICYWNGSIVQLKTEEMLVTDNSITELAETDADIQERGVDDIISMLITKGAITIDDVPTELKDKYNNRKTLRENL